MLINDGYCGFPLPMKGVLHEFPKKQFNLLSLFRNQPVGKIMRQGKSPFQSKSGDIWVGTRWQSVYRMDRNGVTKHVFRQVTSI